MICCWSNIAFVIVAAATVSGYSFDNSEFNQFLANDLDDLYSNFLHHRARRAPPPEDDRCGPPRHRPKLCCAEEVFKAMHEADRDIKQLCFKEITGMDRPEKPPHFDPFRCENMEKHRSEINCVFQCVAQKKGLADDSGNVIEDEYMKYVKELLAEAPYMNSMVDKIAQDCLKEADTEEASDGGCNPTAIKLAHCLFRDIQLNCPEDQIEDKQSCEMLQERLRSGPPPQSR